MVGGQAAAGDRFGRTIGFVDGISEQVLLIGVPDDVEFGTGAVIVIPTVIPTPRIWRPGLGGIPTGAARIGDALAAVTGS